MTLVLPSLGAPTTELPTPPSQQIPAQNNPAPGANAAPSGEPMPNGGFPVIQGNGLTGTTNPPVAVLLSQGAVPAQANPTNAVYAAGLTSVLAQMATGALQANGVMTAANPTPYNGN